MRSRTRALPPGPATHGPDSSSPRLMPDLSTLMPNSLLTSMLPIGNLLSCYLPVTHIDRIAASKFEVKVYSRSTYVFTHTHGYSSGNLRHRIHRVQPFARPIRRKCCTAPGGHCRGSHRPSVASLG